MAREWFEDTAIGGGGRSFPSTRHSVLLSARSTDESARRVALDLLVTAYWKPVYKYIRLKWRQSNEDAKDLTQAFFARALERDFFDRYDSSRASFRTYMRLALDGFVANELKAAARLKRGGGVVGSFDFDAAEEELGRAVPAPDLPPEDLFHQEWLRSLFSLAVDRLRSDYLSRGRQQHFELFARYDLDEEGSQSLTYQQLAAEFNLPVTTVTNYLAAARRDFRRTVLDALRELTADEREFRYEARIALGVEL